MASKASLRSRLPEIITELKTAVDPALLRGARLIAEEARASAPVATGTLRDSIEARSAQGHNQAEVVAIFYYQFIEFGTRFMAAHPFMVPALERHRERVEEEVRKVLRSL